MLKKQRSGKYIVMGRRGKKLSKPLSKEGALKTLRQIEYFKHLSKK